MIDHDHRLKESVMKKLELQALKSVSGGASLLRVGANVAVVHHVPVITATAKVS
jgi:hypothetical protein